MSKESSAKSRPQGCFLPMTRDCGPCVPRDPASDAARQPTCAADSWCRLEEEAEPMRLVLVGVRGQGNHWVKILRRSAEVEVVGYVDVVPEHLAALRAEHGVSEAQCFSNLGAALAAVRPDGVVCVTPPAFHRVVAEQALQAGCHVLTEKPLADTWGNCRAMVADAARAKRVLMVGQNYRYDRAIQTLRGVIAGGAIGTPGQVAVQFFKGPHFGGFRDEMRYPLVIDMSIHHFDLMRYVLGADPISIQAHSWNPSWSWYQGDASIAAFVEMRLVADATHAVAVTYTGSWCANGGETTWNGDWRVLCDDGCVVLTGDQVRVQHREGRPWEDVAPVSMARTSQEYLLTEFLAAIREGRQPETSGVDNLRSIEMVFGTVESIEQGRRVMMAGQ